MKHLDNATLWSRRRYSFISAYRLSKVHSISSLAFYGRRAAARSGRAVPPGRRRASIFCPSGRVCVWPRWLLALMKCFLPEGDLLSLYLLLQSIKHLNDDQCQWASCPAVDENTWDSSSQNRSTSLCLFVFLMPHGPSIKCGLAYSCILRMNSAIGTTRTPPSADFSLLF